MNHDKPHFRRGAAANPQALRPMHALALACALVAISGCAHKPANPEHEPARTVVETAADLPRLGYRVPLQPSKLLDDAAALTALAAAIERDTARVLATHDIRDVAARQELLRARANAALLGGRIAEAHALTGRAQAIEGKPALRLTGMLEVDGLLAASKAATPDAAKQAYRQAVLDTLAQLPAGQVRSRIIELRANLDSTSPARRRGQLMVYADPVWQPDADLPFDLATWTLHVAVREQVAAPYLPVLREALTEWIRANPMPADADIWSSRAVTLTAADQPAPVAVAIWDAGVDPSVFAGRNAVAPGLAFDEHWRPTTGDLKPVSADIVDKRAFAERIARGGGDLRAGLDNADVDFFRNTIAGLKAEDIDAFDALNRSYFAGVHGTLVADIASRGNPAIRIVPIRISFSDAPVPPPVDEAVAARLLEAARQSIAHMRREGVRVANMSWGMTATDIENLLAANHVEADTEKRTARAQAIFDTLFDGMSALIAEAPEILFVIAAGNANQDLDFQRDMPGSINLPNVLSVAATDASGVLSTFASTGPSVDLHALGEDIEALVPGGGRIRASGASLSAPAVVNAAAQVLSVRPDLDTADLVALLKGSATRSAEGLALLDTRAAVVLATAKGR